MMIVDYKKELIMVKIFQIIYLENKVFFYCKKIKCLGFDYHYHAFEIMESDDFIFIQKDSFYDYRPFNELKCLEKNDNRLLVRPYGLYSF